MGQEQLLRIERKLQDVPKGTLKVEHHFNGHTETNLFTESFRIRTAGKGKMTAYQVFPGIQLSLNNSLCEQVSFQHESHAHILEINHCQTGRIGWNFNNGTSVYLGTGAFTAWSAARILL